MEIFFNLSGGTLTVSLDGELDEHNSHFVRVKLDNLIAMHTFNYFVLDFSKVTFMDSTGIGVLLGRYKKLRAIGVPFVIKNTQPQVDKVFNASGLFNVITKI